MIPPHYMHPMCLRFSALWTSLALLAGCPHDSGSSIEGPPPPTTPDPLSSITESTPTPTTPTSDGTGPAVDSGEPATSTDTAPMPDPASCIVPWLDELHAGWVPPNPFAAWLDAPACLLAPHDTIIVLGCPSNDDGTPSSCQQRRVDMAIELHLAGYGDRFLTTGGAVYNAFVEAESMRDLLVDAGVPTTQIWVEPQAEHTDENLYYSTQIMLAEGWDSALVVSEPDHLLYAAVCDANCCVDLGRLSTFGFPVASGITKAGSYILTPPSPDVTQDECDPIERPTLFLCTNLDTRRACADDLQL